MGKTTKSTLMEELERSSVLNNPEMVNVVIAEEMFFLHLLSDLSKTFEFSRSILRKLCSCFCSKRIDNLFDKVVTPSIKYNERDVRAQGLDRHRAYEISGPVQKQPPDFLLDFCNNEFQQTSIKFLVASWEDDANANVNQGFQISAIVGISIFLLKLKMKN